MLCESYLSLYHRKRYTENTEITYAYIERPKRFSERKTENKFYSIQLFMMHLCYNEENRFTPLNYLGGLT